MRVPILPPANKSTKADDAFSNPLYSSISGLSCPLKYPAFDLISGGLISVGIFTNQKSLHTDTITNQMTLEQNREIDDRGLLRRKPQVGSYGWLDDLCSVKDQD